jgi:hypothetical protein
MFSFSPVAGNALPAGSTIFWKGTWAAQVYEDMDAVEYNGSAYIANSVTTVNNVPGVSDKWDLWVSQGPAWAPDDSTVFDFGET